MTKRDKQLLYFLAIFLMVSFSLYFFIVPQLRKTHEQREENLAMQKKLAGLEEKNQGALATKTEYSLLLQDVSEMAKGVQPLMPPEKVGAFLTGAAERQSGLAVGSLQLSSPVQVAGDGGDVGLWTVTARVHVSGPEEALLGYLDALTKDGKGVTIDSVSHSRVGGGNECDITVTVMMYEESV